MLRNIREVGFNLKMVMKKIKFDEWKEVPHEYIICGICPTCKVLNQTTKWYNKKRKDD